ncbi:MAG: neutral/alkaline non-lysosomal ceramidase N-terminal domain-containing protein [Myxococcales bacterium]|nr:neutral/alkaline non-lysosomal ceramidase N-terminal domain-containing protein [Myxococcales bacterium]
MPRLICLSFAALTLACGGDPPVEGNEASSGEGSASSSSTTAASAGSESGPSSTPTSDGSAEASADGTSGPGPTSAPDPTTGADPTSGGPTSTTTTGDDTGTSTDDTDDTTTGAPLEHFLLGMHVQDLSPSDAHLSGNDLYMGAYGGPYTRGAAQGVHDPIYARSFAVEGNGGGLIMTITDLPGMGNEVTHAVREKVAAMTGLEPWQVLIGSTHSHSAPDFMGLWGGVQNDYYDFLVDQTVASMVGAWEGRVPGELRVATGKAPANNRRGWGFTDDDMTILDAVDLQQQRIGTLVVFAAHPVVLGEDNKLISCDYPGYMVKALEAELGAPVALFNGTLGDATPKVPDGMYADDFARADAYGMLLAEIAASIVAEGAPVSPELTWSEKSWVQAVDNQLFKAASLLPNFRYKFDMVGLLDFEVTTQTTYFRLGKQVQGAAFPGEPLTRLGLDIKAAMKTPHKVVLGNTGDALGYFIPGDEWMTGKNDNYEEQVSLGESAGDNARGNIVALIEADNANF